MLATQPGAHQLRPWLLLDSRTMGGIETHVAVLAAGLRAAGHAPLVVFWQDHGDHPLRARLDTDGLPWMALPGSVPDAIRALRRGRPDILHTHGYKAGVFGRLIGRALGIPVASTFHAGEPGTGRVRLYNILDRLTAPLAGCIAVSEPIRRRLPPSARTIENFLAVPPLAPRDAPSAGTVAFVGRLSHEKGPDIFCRIAQSFGPDVRFEVYGDGPMRGALEAAHGDRVTFHGLTADMDRRWPGIGLLCMPSRHEGLPMAALEAMANGVPVAAFAVGALPDLVSPGQTGWLAQPGDEEALQRTVGTWAALPAATLSLLSANARHRIEERYCVTAGVRKVLEVYARSISTTVVSSPDGPAASSAASATSATVPAKACKAPSTASGRS